MSLISTGFIPRSSLRKNYFQTFKSLSFPNASIGNPDPSAVAGRRNWDWTPD